MTGTVLLIILALIFIGVLPLWPYSKNWGYRASVIPIALMVLTLIGIFAGRF